MTRQQWDSFMADRFFRYLPNPNRYSGRGISHFWAATSLMEMGVPWAASYELAKAERGED